MKSLKLLLLLSLFLAGCADIKVSECPPGRENLTVNFSLKDKDGREVLPLKIENIEFFIYNQAGIKVKRSSVTKAELDLFSGMKYELDPGKYTLIGWANFNDCSMQLFTNPDAQCFSQDDNYVVQPIADGDGNYSNGSPLYHSARSLTPLTVTVPSEGVIEVTAPFRQAHIKMEVSIKGYTSTRSTEPLTVELTDLIPHYGFDLAAFGTPVCYRQSAAIVGDKHIAMFNTPLFTRTTDMQIKVMKSDGSLIAPAIRIADLILEGIDMEEVDHMPIEITFSGMRVSVSVNLPGWDEEYITGEI